jgi:hypothetical protein
MFGEEQMQRQERHLSSGCPTILEVTEFYRADVKETVAVLLK